MKYRLILFDFDGTLANTMPLLSGLADHIADRFHFQRPDQSNLETLRGLDARTLMRMHNIPMWKVPLIGAYTRKLMTEQIHLAEIFEGIDRLLPALVQSGSILGIISSNSCENIRLALGPANASCFQYYECGVSLFGKTPRLRKLMKKSRVPAGETIYIGDELRDIEAARAAGVACGTVSWGYGRLDILQANNPTVIFTQVDQIFPFVAGE